MNSELITVGGIILGFVFLDLGIRRLRGGDKIKAVREDLKKHRQMLEGLLGDSESQIETSPEVPKHARPVVERRIAKSAN